MKNQTRLATVQTKLLDAADVFTSYCQGNHTSRNLSALLGKSIQSARRAIASVKSASPVPLFQHSGGAGVIILTADGQLKTMLNRSKVSRAQSIRETVAQIALWSRNASFSVGGIQ
jgi:hypothetical protein